MCCRPSTGIVVSVRIEKNDIPTLIIYKTKTDAFTRLPANNLLWGSANDERHYTRRQFSSFIYIGMYITCQYISSYRSNDIHRLC